jgi:hypothetical protein
LNPLDREIGRQQRELPGLMGRLELAIGRRKRTPGDGPGRHTTGTPETQEQEGNQNVPPDLFESAICRCETPHAFTGLASRESYPSRC